MEPLLAEINKVSTKLDAIEQLLQKPFQTWTEEEKEEFGTKEQLREEELGLVKLQTILLQREQNQSIQD
jgi:hypothetical protein